MNFTHLTYEAHGKLLLTGEYFVLDGAVALAVPTRRGQRLRSIAVVADSELHWRSLTHTGDCWFDAKWRRDEQGVTLLSGNDSKVAARLQQLLEAIRVSGEHTLDPLFGRAWEIDLNFPRDWGLGSSSTLISLLAQATQTDPYTLLAKSFGGSGYDLACAQAEGAILYQLENGQPKIQALDWQPPYAEQLYFVHLGRKQNSRTGIRLYRELGGTQVSLLEEVSKLTQDFLAATNFAQAARVAAAHEELVSSALSLPRVQTRHFKDFPGVVKSLGAWGGDFVLAFSELDAANTLAYFQRRDFGVVFPWAEMVY